MRRLLVTVLLFVWFFFLFLYFVVGSGTTYLYLNAETSTRSLSLHETITTAKPGTSFMQPGPNSPFESVGPVTDVEYAVRARAGQLELLKLSYGPVKSKFPIFDSNGPMLLDVSRKSVSIVATFYALSGMLTLILCFRIHRAILRILRRRNGCCPDCGYSLQGIESELCPECGKPTRDAQPIDI